MTTPADRYTDENNSSPGERRISGHLMCMADGCPLRGTASLGGGWLCSFHMNAPASRWPSITRKLLTSDCRAARHAIASLRLAIAQGRTEDLPVLMARTQRLVMQAGATSEDVRLRTLTDIGGNEFQEPAEHFANRMDFCLVRIIAPNDEPRPKPRSEGRRLEQTVSVGEIASALDSIVEAA